MLMMDKHAGTARSLCFSIRGLYHAAAWHACPEGVVPYHWKNIQSLPELIEGRLCIGDCYRQAWPMFIDLCQLQVKCWCMSLFREHFTQKFASRNARNLEATAGCHQDKAA